MNKKLLVKKRGELIPGLTLTIPSSGIISVGSDASATIELEEGAVAPEQFVIVCEDGQMTLLCRADNTEINGKLFPKGSLHNLELHDTIIVGDYLLNVETTETAEKFLSDNADEILAIQENSEITAPKTTLSEPEKTVEKTLPDETREQAFEDDKSLSDVLEGLKAEEKFYFLIENGNQEKRRIYIEKEEMWFGWAATGEFVISENQADIALPRAQIRKDWSGVILYPLRNKNIWLNNQVLDEPHRLKNDDSLQMSAKDKVLPDTKINIKFHEPTALLVLDSILPKELPPPVSLDKKWKSLDQIGESLTEDLEKLAAFKGQPPEKLGNGRLFGYFTGSEIFIMIVGILVAATLIFLVLEYY